MTGDIVKEIIHNDGSTDNSWDLSSKTDLDVVSGLYFYVVKANIDTFPEKQTGKFVILRGEQ